MALFPCSVDRHVYRGSSNSMYTAIVNGIFATRSKLRLCDEHARQRRNMISEHLQLVRVGDQSRLDEALDNPSCGWCKADVAPYQVFANVYLRGAEEEAWWGAACESCLPAAAQDAILTL
jgi:hypothetical protein